MKHTIFFIALLFSIALFTSCKQHPPYKPNSNETLVDFQKGKWINDDSFYNIITIDSCEYIFGKDRNAYNGGYFLTHKGNCKFCEKRKLENNNEMEHHN